MWPQHPLAAGDVDTSIDRHALHLMREDAYLINTARGTVVDEVALVTMLQQGVIAGAGLDVFEREPELTQGLTQLPNVVLAPHLGSATVRTRTEMGLLAVRNLLAVLDGNEPPNRVT